MDRFVKTSEDCEAVIRFAKAVAAVQQVAELPHSRAAAQREDACEELCQAMVAMPNFATCGET